MKRQDKEIRMRPYGAVVYVKITILTVIAFLCSSICSYFTAPVYAEPNYERVLFQEEVLIKRIEHQREVFIKEREARNNAIKLQARIHELNRKMDSEFKRREDTRIAEEKRLEEERIAREERETRAKEMLYSGAAGEYQAYAWSFFESYGWDENELQCLIWLWHRESHWNPLAHNNSSGAHGIPQSLPASKMASHGSDYWDNGYTQIRWGLDYIANRYGSPSRAWAHSEQTGWY